MGSPMPTSEPPAGGPGLAHQVTNLAAIVIHGLRRWELDVGGLFIATLERMGLAWRVVRVSPERQRAKASSSPAAPRLSQPSEL